jgi:hypothetical protein
VASKLDWSGFFACKGIIDLGQAVLHSGSASHQSAFVHLATNSVHFYWSDTDRRESELLQLQCNDCSRPDTSIPLTIDHLTICPSVASTHVRAALCSVVRLHLSAFPSCAAWLLAHGRSSLSDVMSSLFPLPVTATPEEVILHLPRCMIGGFTTGEVTRASKILRFATPRDGQSASTNFDSSVSTSSSAATVHSSRLAHLSVLRILHTL